jgi:hypothetical protein
MISINLAQKTRDKLRFGKESQIVKDYTLLEMISKYL